jgi:ribose-phosphate pyrophosphokinase
LGTLKKASDLLMEKGAKSVRAITTHGVLSGKAYENLDASMLTELLISDSIQSKPNDKIKVISCADIIAKTIWSLTNKKSIHEEINLI